MTITYGEIREAREDAINPSYDRQPMRYGGNIPTRYSVRLATDSPTGRFRRVFACSYGNGASIFVTVLGEDIFLSDTELAMALGR